MLMKLYLQQLYANYLFKAGKIRKVETQTIKQKCVNANSK